MPYVWRCQISYNGSGTFNINTAGQPVVTGTVISSTAFNALTADLGTGLSTALTKDGQTVATARIPFAAGINSSLVTDATSTTTGSIITAGGVGIAKALFVGTTANIAGTTTLAGVTATSITDSGLTSGRVTYAGTAGLLQDSANLTFNGTTLTANTIGAFTLSGTVAGGGNQLNNVIIGTTTPLAGSFTTLSTTGAVTVGNGANSSLLITTDGANNFQLINKALATGGTNYALEQNYLGTTYLNSASGQSAYIQIGGANVGQFSSTGLAVTGTLTSTLDATHYGVTVGRGGGAVSTNTAVGASALAANTTGDINVAVGYLALAANIAGRQCVAVGKSALAVNNGDLNVAIGESTLSANTSGTQNTGCGSRTLTSVISGSYNSALGYAALNLNTGSYNVAVGVQALAANTTASNNTAVGYQAQYSGNVAYQNTSLGYQSLYTNISAPENTAIGYQSLYFATAGGNTAVGFQSAYNTAGGYQNSVLGDGALYSNTSGALNTAVGYKALYSNLTASNNTAVGYQAGYSNTTGTQNTYSGYWAGYLTTGSTNSFFGYGAGSSVTTGGKNTIIGGYNGNQGGLDIRTASNYVVLSDGDGNPRGYFDSSGIYYVLGTNGQILCGTTTSSGNFSNSTGSAGIAFYGATHATVANKVVVTPGTNGVYMNSGATAWTAVSDERFKDIIEPISDAVTKVSSLRAVIGKFKTDEKNVRRSFLIAQDVQAVLPEAIDATNPDQLGVAYTDVIPLLVAAIKELSAKVTALENK